MPRFVRAAALTHYVEIAVAHGLDPWQMVREVGLSSACLDDPNLRLPMDPVTQLLETSAARSGAEAFGLLMVEGRRLSNLGVLGLLTREEPNLRQALVSSKRYGTLHNQALVQRVEESDGIATIYEDLLTGQLGYTRQGVEMVLGVVVRMIKVLLGADWQARRICFSHPEPLDLSVHRRVLGQTPEFGCEFNGIVVTSADLDTPIASADPAMSDLLRKQLRLEGQAQSGVADEVRQMIMLLLPRGRCTAEQIAQLMGVTRRTLHRRLDAEGQSYFDMLQTIRLELSKSYVAEARRPLRDVAQMLGFGELSSFSRWHRESFGTTAEALRRAPKAPTKPLSQSQSQSQSQSG